MDHVYRIYKLKIGFQRHWDWLRLRFVGYRFVYHYDAAGCILVTLSTEQFESLNEDEKVLLNLIEEINEGNAEAIVQREALVQNPMGLESCKVSVVSMLDENLNAADYNFQKPSNVVKVRGTLRSIDLLLRDQLHLPKDKSCLNINLIFEILRLVDVVKRRDLITKLIVNEIGRYFDEVDSLDFNGVKFA